MKKKSDYVDLIEACYAERPTDDAWLDNVLETAAPLTNQGLGVYAFCYDAREYPLKTWSMRATAENAMPVPVLEQALAGATPEYVEHSWRRLHAATASEVPGWNDEPSRRNFFDSIGLQDVLAINAYDPSGVGCMIGTPLPRVVRLRKRERSLYERLAMHLSAAFRLRRRLRDAEAILSTSGALLDAKADDVKEARARASLQDAVRDIERARGKMRREDPDGAVLSWRALVSARWSVVDHFESDGKRLLVAFANAPAPVPVAKLSDREGHVLARIAKGQTTKQVAYELGIADSTVRVLLLRAMRTLGVKTRDQAIARYGALASVQTKTRDPA